MNKKCDGYIRPFRFQLLQSFPYIVDDFDQYTEYQLFCKLVEKVNEVIGNENEITKEVNDIKEYLETLDLQDEVNNKLDEMAEDGTLQEIMSAYLNSKAIFGFDSVSSMKSSTNLINGSYAKTLGFYSINDGGGATYKIRTITNEDVINEIDLIALTNDNTLIAELLPENESINILQLGCKGDNSFDNTTRIQRGIDKYNNIYIPRGKFLIGDTLIYKRFTKITGENKIDSIIIMDPTIEKAILQSYDFDNLTGNASPYWQWDDRTNCFFEFRNFRIDGNYRDSSNEILKTEGNGINNYGTSYIIDNVYIDNCAGIGFYNEWTNPTSPQGSFRAGNQITKINIDIFNCGKEGLYNDLGDATIERLFTGNCGISQQSTIMNTNYCHNVVLNKGGEFGEVHIYGCASGYGLYIQNQARFRCKSIIVESCCGGILTDTSACYIQIGNLQLHNMLYQDQSSYENDFYYLHQKNSGCFNIATAIMRVYAGSSDIGVIGIENNKLEINNLFLQQTTTKTKPAITNISGGRFIIKGILENGSLAFKGNTGNATQIDLDIINYARVVETTFTIGNGSHVNFTGTLYENQKFADNLISHPALNSFTMNMNIDGVNYRYPGLTNSITPDLTTANTNKYANVYYNLPFLLNPNEIDFKLYKDSSGNWGDVNISIVSVENATNAQGNPYAPIKYIYSGTSAATDYHINGKYGS